MQYLKVSWHHNLDSEPYEIWSELDSNRYEVRKIELYEDGHVGIASTNYNTVDCRLSTEPLPLLADINSDSQFIGCVVSSSRFEDLWSHATI